MNTTQQTALGIIDGTRCFYPAYEGERLGIDGFGELGVDGAEKINDPINTLTQEFNDAGITIVHTVENHPEETAHFSDTPDFIKTWPKHGRKGTAGALLHPDLLIAREPKMTKEFIKGDVVARTPDEDNSYTGVLAHDPEGTLMPDYLRKLGVTTIYLVGLALGDGAENKLCVDSTATDLFNQGFEVNVVTDAVEAVLPENREKCFINLGRVGIQLLTVAEALQGIKEA